MIKGSTFNIPCKFFLVFLQFHTNVEIVENVLKIYQSYLFLGFIAAFLFFIQSGDPLYDP